MNAIILATVIVGALGLIFGIILSVCSIIMHVDTDETVEKLRAEMPGANCGACGYSGCDGYAEALFKGEAKPGLCAPGGQEVNDRLGEILGVKVEMADPKCAVVLCNGSCDHVTNKMHYVGVETCKAANTLYAGTLECNYGCIGLGDCFKVCQYGAISIVDGKAVVDRSKCTACSACVNTCPKGIIELLPKDIREVVSCSNKDKGAVARKVCEVACIACGKCVRTCQYDAIEVIDNVARINYDKCVRCGECVKACPTKCITLVD